MKLIVCLLLLGPLCGYGQSFNWPLKEATKVPRPVVIQLKKYLEKHENYPVMPEEFTQVPSFNVLHPSQREFIDGIYYFFLSDHDTGSPSYSSGGIKLL